MKQKPLPKLSAEKKAGKAPLNTFGELLAFLKKDEPKPPEPTPEPPKAEERKAAAPAPPEAPKPEGEQPPAT